MKRLLATLVALLLASCANGEPGPSDERVDVVAAFYPIAEAAERVGGNEVRVTNLTPPGTEPHDLELSSEQVDRVLDADVVLYLSGFQPALEDVLEGAEGDVVNVREGLATIDGDPHVWLDPVAMTRIAERIGELLDADPEPYIDTLNGLDQDMSQGLLACERRTIVTSHAAFAYLASRFELRQEAVSGISPEAEPDPERLAELADLVEDEGVTTIFTEPLVSPKVTETLARETGARVATLDPIEGLTPEQIERGDDYATVMRRNLAALRRGLGCD